MVFIGVRFHESRETVKAKIITKVIAKESDLLLSVVKNGVAKLLKREGKDPTDKAVDAAIKRIESITTNTTDPGACDLLDFIGEPDSTLKALNGADTPILTDGIDILLPKEIIDVDVSTEPLQKKQKTCAFAAMMGKNDKCVKYLQYVEDLDKEQHIDEQIKQMMYGYLEDIGLGYRDDKQEAKLKSNTTKIKQVLCFVQNYWKVLLRAEFPHLPAGSDIDFSSSKFISELTTMTRMGSKKPPQISSSVISDNITVMSNLRWSDFAVPVFKDALVIVRDEINLICALLQRHKDSLDGKCSSMRQHRSTPTPGKKSHRGTVAAFEKSLNLVQLDDNEFHVVIDSAKKRNRPKGRLGGFAACVAAAIKKVFSDLRHKEDYSPTFLSDEEIGLNNYAELEGFDVVNAATRANWRAKFRRELNYGIESMMIHVYGKLNPGTNDPDSLFVWKVPFIHNAQHAGRVAKAINECKEMAPKKMSLEAMKHTDTILKGITDLSAEARAAVRNFLYLGDPDPDDKIADEYVDFVLHIAAGNPVEESMLRDRRQGNSRGGKGIDATTYQPFWDCCKEVLLPEARVEERRHSDTMYASAAHSIPNLVKQVTDLLTEKVSSGKLEKMPPIPSLEWVRLQFIPNNSFAKIAAKFTGHLGVMRGVQSRTLRKEHIDQHWVNAFVRYHLEWMVELKGSGFGEIAFFGQDDKSKIPIGDEVHVSTGVRANNKGIVPANANNLKALDHDFCLGKGIASVTLFSNIPSSIAGSFFVGGEEGEGQIFVTCRDAVFDGSEIFDHCAQLIDVVRSRGVTPTVLVLQTDGGPDHSLKRVAVKLALLALFRKLDIDRLIVLRCAPNGSAANFVERSMSVLNLPLAHASLKRAGVPEWARRLFSSCNSMKQLRDAAAKVDKEREDAAKSIPTLRARLNAAELYALVPECADKIFEGVEEASGEGKKRVVDLIRSMAGLTHNAATDVAGAIALPSGRVQVVHNETLQISVLQSKLKAAEEIASRNLEEEWSRSMSAPLNDISRRFSDLTTGGRPVVVRDRVPREDVELLYEELKKIDSHYNSNCTNKEHLSTVPLLTDFFKVHAVTTPYSLDLIKCSNNSCCGDLKTPEQFRDLALQRQPTPIMNPKRKKHFYSRREAIGMFSGNDAALTDFSDLPSYKNEGEKTKAQRDQEMTKVLKLKSWDGKKVRSIVSCFHCGKRRCIYSPTDEKYYSGSTALQQELESVSHRYSCGDLIFEDGSEMSKVIVQKLNLTCETQIEKGYYHNEDRSLKLKPICIHCGESGTAGSFLLGQKELRERNLTGGFKCFPICVECHGSGKKVVKGKTKDQLAARAERSNATN
eukprot:scaffold9466_cov85-Skeletonema_dohrnii-CCMP3373.AAC.1